MEKCTKLNSQQEFANLLSAGMRIYGDDELMIFEYDVVCVDGETVIAKLSHAQNVYLDNHYHPSAHLFEPHELQYKSNCGWKIGDRFYSGHQFYADL